MPAALVPSSWPPFSPAERSPLVAVPWDEDTPWVVRTLAAAVGAGRA